MTGVARALERRPALLPGRLHRFARRPRCGYILGPMRGRYESQGGFMFVGEAHTTDGGANVTSLTNNVPTGVLDGDLLFWAVSVALTTAATTPGAWTAVTNIAYTGGGRLFLYQRTASSEPGSYAITIPNGRAVSSMVAFRGCSPTLDAAATTQSSGAPTAAVATQTITTVAVNAIVLRVVGINTASAHSWATSTKIADIGNSAGSAGVSMAYAVRGTPGATGTETDTIVSSRAGSIVLSIAPL